MFRIFVNWLGLEPRALPILNRDALPTELPINFPQQNIIKKSSTYVEDFCELAGTRTQGPYIKSVLLYQLSYQFFRSLLSLGVQK